MAELLAGHHRSSAERPRILVLSNGHGEDSIAAEIVRRIGDRAAIEAYPLIGDGGSYRGLCPVVGPRSYLPSQGSRRRRGALAGDIVPMARSALAALRFLRDEARLYDRSLAVGDATFLYLALLSGHRIDTYVDVYKSGFAHRYSRAEAAVLKRVTAHVLCRDTLLAESLLRHGVNARSAGNVMIDTIAYGEYAVAARRRAPLAVLLLPGSRDSAGAQLALQLAAVRLVLTQGAIDVFVALAGGIAPESLAAATGTVYHPPASAQAADMGTLSDDGLTVHLVAGALGNLLEDVDLVLSQGGAGTATQQAVSMGLPVVSTADPDDRPKRQRDDRALLGPSWIPAPPDPRQIAAALGALLANPAERERLGKLGRERLGGPGAVGLIIDTLLRA